jgi:hypothetical protein
VLILVATEDRDAVKESDIPDKLSWEAARMSQFIQFAD